MMIVARIFLLIALAVFTHAYNFNVDVGKSLDGKIIHLESLRYRGHWLKSSYHNGGKWVAVSGLPEKDTYYTKWSKFLIKDVGEEVVLFESMTYPNHFFDAHHSEWVGLTYSTYPNDKDKAQWKIRCTSSRLSLSTESNSGAVQKKSLTIYEGTIDTTTTSNTITTTVSVEVQKAFVTASASFTHEWKQVNTNSFEKQTTLKYDITIPAYTKIDLKQLTGKYGPFETQAKKFKIDETNLTTGKRSVKTLDH